MDETLINNTVALNLAQKLGVASAVEFRQVDLYINGSYRGNYLLTESIDVGEGRVEINDTEKLNEEACGKNDLDSFPFKESDEDGNNTRWRELPAEADRKEWAFLLELDMKNVYDSSLCKTQTPFGNVYASQNPENASEGQMKYISAFLYEAEQALYSESGYNNIGRYYSDYYDLESLAKVYAFQELTANYLGQNESVFLYMPQQSEKLFFGPAWDFDGNSLKEAGICKVFSVPQLRHVSVFFAAYHHEDFIDELKKVWQQFSSTFSYDDMFSLVDSIAGTNLASAVCDMCRWSAIEMTTQKASDIYNGYTRSQAEEYANRYFNISRGLSENGAEVFYEYNDGYFVSERSFVEAGTAYTVLSANEANMPLLEVFGIDDNDYQDEDFICWVDSATGNKYFPGDEIILSPGALYLKAMWKDE